jgi:hypothetical protein
MRGSVARLAYDLNDLWTFDARVEHIYERSVKRGSGDLRATGRFSFVTWSENIGNKMSRGITAIEVDLTRL